MDFKVNKVREEFLADKSENAKRAYRLIFKKANDFEDEIGKPFEEITEDEFNIFMKKKLIGKSTDAVCVKVSECKKYLNYVGNNCADNITRGDIRKLVDESEYEIKYVNWNDLKDNLNKLENEIDRAIVCLLRLGVSGKDFQELVRLKVKDIDLENKRIRLNNRTIKIEDDRILQMLKYAIKQNSYSVILHAEDSSPTSTEYNFNMSCEYLIKQRPTVNNDNGLNCYKFSGITAKLNRIFHVLDMGISAINLLQSYSVDRLIEQDEKIGKILSTKEAKDYLNSIGSIQDAYDIVHIAEVIREKNKDELGQVKCLINLNNYTNIDEHEEIIDIKNLGDSIRGIERLNEIYANTNIEQKEKLVKVIERGKIANKIKEYRQYKCQICESLGHNPYSFKKKNGEYYVETHHIIPVSDTKNSKLSVDNLICLCPNHHKQVHYGNVNIIDNNDTYVEYNIDGIQVKVYKIKLN